MALSEDAQKIASDLSGNDIKLGEIKKRAREIKKDHELAMELWGTGNHPCRLLATLIFDKKLLSESLLDQLAADMRNHDDDERDQLADWLLANQLMKDKRLVELLQTWQAAKSPIFRRLFWYHQARLRWMGRTPPDNSAMLLDSLESGLAHAEPEVQWAMNFCAGWIGVFEPEFRPRCIRLGKSLGLYREEKVAKNCTPAYLPEFIRIEVEKRA